VFWLNIKCIVLGHDDRMRRASGRVFLKCEECGRETHGWYLGRESARTVSPGTRAHPVQQLRQALWQRLRQGFAAVGLR
jgi:hypothetical protein